MLFFLLSRPPHIFRRRCLHSCQINTFFCAKRFLFGRPRAAGRHNRKRPVSVVSYYNSPTAKLDFFRLLTDNYSQLVIVGDLNIHTISVCCKNTERQHTWGGNRWQQPHRPQRRHDNLPILASTTTKQIGTSSDLDWTARQSHIIALIKNRKEIRKRCKCDPGSKPYLNHPSTRISQAIAEEKDQLWRQFLDRVGPNKTSSRPFWKRIYETRQNNTAFQTWHILDVSSNKTQTRQRSSAASLRPPSMALQLIN